MSVQSFTNLFISTKCLISFPLCYLLWGSLCLNKPIKPQYKQGLQILLMSGVSVTPSVTSVESSGQCWRKICQIWRICEPWYKEQGRQGFFRQEVYYYMTGIKGWLNWTWTTSILCGNILHPSSHAPVHFQTRHFDQSIYCINIAKLKLSGQHIELGKLHQHSNWHVPGQINHTFCKEGLGVPQMIEMKCSLRPG